MKTRKKFKNKEKKVFTRGESNIIIKKDCNPLSKDYKKIYKRGWLFMKGIKEVELEEVRKRLDWKGKIIVKVFPKTFVKIYKIGITFGYNNK